jgi:hypothetical protein
MTCCEVRQCQHEEFLLSVTLVGHDLGVGGDDLVLGVHGVVLLEFEITDSSRKCEVTCRISSEHVQHTAASDPPLTRPNSTKPPALLIRVLSSVFVGLWSLLKGLASPLYPKTLRESPELAWISV